MNILQVLQTLRDDLKVWTLNVFNAYDAKVNLLTEDKMDKENPSGSGTFSLNRRANTTIGVDSVAIGSNCEASGQKSCAEGSFTSATGLSSHAEGHATHATGPHSHTEGWCTEANGSTSHAEGHTTIANGYASHAEGYGTIASATSQHVQGQNNIEDLAGEYLHIVGNGNFESKTRSNAHTLDWDGNAWFAGDVYAGGENVKDPLTKLVTLAEIPHETPGIITGSIDVNNPIARDWDMDANYLKFLELDEIGDKQFFTNFDILFNLGPITLSPENYDVILTEPNEQNNQAYALKAKNDTATNVYIIGYIIRTEVRQVITQDHTLVLTPGFWVYDRLAQCTFNLIEYTEPGMVITRLDEKFLPEGMMLVPIPSAENEGNVLQVVNGQPTWVSIPSAESSTF